MTATAGVCVCADRHLEQAELLQLVFGKACLDHLFGGSDTAGELTKVDAANAVDTRQEQQDKVDDKRKGTRRDEQEAAGGVAPRSSCRTQLPAGPGDGRPPQSP